MGKGGETFRRKSRRVANLTCRLSREAKRVMRNSADQIR